MSEEHVIPQAFGKLYSIFLHNL